MSDGGCGSTGESRGSEAISRITSLVFWCKGKLTAWCRYRKNLKRLVCWVAPLIQCSMLIPYSISCTRHCSHEVSCLSDPASQLC